MQLCLHVNIGRCNMHKCCYFRFNIVERMQLYSAFMFAKFSPFKHRQAQLNRCRVKCVNMTVKFEYFIDSTLAGLGYHECCILLEDAVVTLLISLAKIASRYRLPDSEMVEFPGMSLHSHNQISEALSIG